MATSSLDALQGITNSTVGLASLFNSSSTQFSAGHLVTPASLLKTQIDQIKNSSPLSGAQQAEQLRLLNEKSGIGSTSSSLSTLSTKLNDLRAKATELRSKGPFEGFDIKVSDTQYLTATSQSGTTPVGEYDITIQQLADSSSGKQLIYTLNGTQYTSDSNAVNNAGGTGGLTINFKKVTPGATTPPTTTAVSYGQSNDKIAFADASNFSTGDAVKFSKAFGGLSANTTYYINKGNGNGNANDVQVFSSKEEALAGKNQIDLDGHGGSVSLSGVTVTKDTGVNADGSVSVLVGRSIDEAKKAVSAFFSSFNDTLGFLETATSSGGALDGESSTRGIAAGLRRALLGGFSTLGSALKSNGKDNTVRLDESKLSTILDNSFDKVASAFRGAGNGVASAIESYVAPLVGAGGALSSRITSLDQKSNRIDSQIADINEEAEATRAKLLKSFSSLAKNLGNVNSQNNFISSRFKDSTNSTIQQQQTYAVPTAASQILNSSAAKGIGTTGQLDVSQLVSSFAPTSN